MVCVPVSATEEVCAPPLPTRVCEDGVEDDVFEEVEKSLRSVARSRTVPVWMWQDTPTVDIDGLSTQPSLKVSEDADDDCISVCSFTTDNDSCPDYSAAYAHMMPRAGFLPVTHVAQQVRHSWIEGIALPEGVRCCSAPESGAPFVLVDSPLPLNHGSLPSLLTAGRVPLPMQYMMPTGMCNFAGCAYGTSLPAVMLQPFESQSQPPPPVVQRTPLRVAAKPYICAEERRGSVQLPVTHNVAEYDQDRRRCASVQLPVTRNEVEGECAQTALMLKNLPEYLMRSALFELLRAEGFALDIDFLYVPVDLKFMNNYGFAFVNLVTPEAAMRFTNHMRGFCDWGVHSDNVLEIANKTGYEGSGLDAYVERYRNSRLMHGKVNDEYKPALFKNGARIPFPRPSKIVRLPRSRKEQ
jgi:hypothetical protein